MTSYASDARSNVLTKHQSAAGSLFDLEHSYDRAGRPMSIPARNPTSTRRCRTVPPAVAAGWGYGFPEYKHSLCMGRGESVPCSHSRDHFFKLDGVGHA